MYYEGWHHGCRVTISPWLNGKHRIGVEKFAPGASLSQPPKWERRIFVDDCDIATAQYYIDSVAYNIIYRFNELTQQPTSKNAFVER